MGGVRLIDGNEFCQFFFKQFVFRLETVYFTKRLGQDLAERNPTVELDGLSELGEVEEVLRLVEQGRDDDLFRSLDVAALVTLSYRSRTSGVALTLSSNFSKNLRSIFMPCTGVGDSTYFTRGSGFTFV